MKAKTAEVLRFCFKQAIASTGGAGIRTYIAWAESIELDPIEYYPAPAHLLISYVCHIAGTCSEATARSHVSELRAWHVLTDVEWNESPRLEMALKAVGNIHSGRRARRPPNMQSR